MKNLFLFQTEKPSRLHTDLRDLFLTPKYQIGKEINSIVESRNIYITSDEEIKVGDYYITILDNEIFKADSSTVIIMNDANQSPDTTYKNTHFKIILTSDQELINDGVQAIDDEFLELFVKNPSCEEIEVEKLPYDGTKSITKYWGGEYKITIPKEEPKKKHKIVIVGDGLPKQETLEEVAKRRHRELSTAEVGIIPNFVDGFVEGYGSAQQQMYNELVDLLENLRPIYREDSDFYQKYDKQRLNFVEQLKKNNV